MFRLPVSLFFLLFIQISLAQNQKWKLNSSQSQISYEAIHLLHPWEGVNKHLKGVLLFDPAVDEIKEIAILTQVRDFDSKNSGRDAHALEVLEALSFPEVRFYANLIEYKKDSILIHGQFDFHGVTKNQTLIAKHKISLNKMNLSGTFTLKITDYGIKPPSFMMVKMEDLLNFKFNLTFEK